jgi:hypothetical protein
MIWRLLVVAIVAACTEHVQLGDDGGIPGLVSVAVAPTSTTLEFPDLAAPDQTIAYAATGTFVDGTTRDITTLVTWTSDFAAPGGFAEPAGTFVATGDAGGHLVVRATSGELAGTAELAIVVTGTIVDPAFPPPAGDLFPADAMIGPEPDRQPVVRYPSSDTMLAPGVARPVFQHERGTGNDAFRLRFDSDVLHLTVLTSADRYVPDERAWTLIAGSHPGNTVELRLDATDSAAPATIYSSAPVILPFARATPDDRLYLFLDPVGIAIGGFAATTPTTLLSGMACCHAVSRDGATMALARGEKLETVALDDGTPLVPADSIGMGSAAFSPDGELLLVADRGTLTLRDPKTGAPVGGDGKVSLPPMTKATHPDWSPDGSAVLVAISDDVTNAEIKGGSIARLPFDAATQKFGPLEVLVDSTGDADNNFFPRWSPDGRHLAYVHATSTSRDAKNAELRLLPAAGGTPVPLRLASSRVGQIDDVPDLGSTMPAWTRGADGTTWLAFASTRPYGLVRPVKGASQIWVAAVDANREDDPSYAAFWLSCQDPTKVGNTPVWAPAPTNDVPAD